MRLVVQHARHRAVLRGRSLARRTWPRSSTRIAARRDAMLEAIDEHVPGRRDVDPPGGRLLRVGDPPGLGRHPGDARGGRRAPGRLRARDGLLPRRARHEPDAARLLLPDARTGSERASPVSDRSWPTRSSSTGAWADEGRGAGRRAHARARCLAPLGSPCDDVTHRARPRRLARRPGGGRARRGLARTRAGALLPRAARQGGRGRHRPAPAAICSTSPTRGRRRSTARWPSTRCSRRMRCGGRASDTPAWVDDRGLGAPRPRRRRRARSGRRAGRPPAVSSSPRGAAPRWASASSSARSTCRAAVMAALSFSGAAIVERSVAGTEVAVGLVGSALETLPAVEIVPKNGVYDYAARYTAGATEYFAPARLNGGGRGRGGGGRVARGRVAPTPRRHAGRCDRRRRRPAVGPRGERLPRHDRDEPAADGSPGRRDVAR